MALLTSSPATVSVTSFPYPLPNSAGQVVFIGTNLPRDVRPNTHSVYQWDYANFGYYGGGAFIQDYSAAGAFVIAGSGGHLASPNLGAAIFDCADATWKRLDNANGVPYTRGDDYPPGSFDANGVFPGTTCPGPSHQYGMQSQIRTSQGGGPKGSFIFLAGSAQTTTGASGCDAYRMDLDTRMWTKAATNNAVAYTTGGQQSAFYDPTTNRYYAAPGTAFGNGDMSYLDGNDWTWKRVFYPSVQGNGYYTAAGFIDLQRRIMALWDATGQRFIAMDLNNISAGFSALGMTGTGMSSVHLDCGWAYYPPDGCFYHMNSPFDTPNVLLKLTPPALSGNKMTGWVMSNITSTLSAVTPRRQWSGASNNAVHHNSLFYVPAIQRLAWIAGDAAQVAIIKPS